MRRLWAWFPPKLIGIVEETDNGLTFQYSEEWLKWEKSFRLSASLQKTSQLYKKEAESFFGNLLPEGNARAVLCRKLGISVDNDFELLLRIGHDCAGALILTDKNTVPSDKGDIEELPEENLAEWLKDDSAGILELQVKGDLRLSLAGAQNKLPLIYKNGKFYKPLGSQPTTHILKPPPKGFKNIPQNEWLHGQIYAAFGIETAKSDLIKIGTKYVLLVERYDRLLDSANKWHRLHQEDFCQALAISFKKKYEQEGGPTLLQCCQLIEERSDEVSKDIDAILRWQILNVLTGNCDGHGKNLSLLRQPDGSWRLSPFYDLVDTRLYPTLSHRLAMSVGGQFDQGTVVPEHWRMLFNGAKVSPSAYLTVVKETIEQLPEAFEKAVEKFISSYGSTAFIDDIRTHQTKMLRRYRQNFKLS